MVLTLRFVLSHCNESRNFSSKEPSYSSPTWIPATSTKLFSNYEKTRVSMILIILISVYDGLIQCFAGPGLVPDWLIFKDKS